MNLGSLPVWAWAAAIVGGAVVGFFVLKPKTSEAQAATEAQSSEYPEKARKEGAAGAPPLLLDDLLSGIGLTQSYIEPAYVQGPDSAAEPQAQGSEPIYSGQQVLAAAGESLAARQERLSTVGLALLEQVPGPIAPAPPSHPTGGVYGVA